MDDFSNLTDSKLVELCLARGSKDERPFAEIFHRHQGFVTRILFRYFSHEQDVEDLTQEVFFKAYRNLHQFEQRSSLKTWLFSIASNTAKNEFRLRSRRLVVAEESLQEMDEKLSNEAFSKPQHGVYQRENLQQAFSKLNPHEKEIFLLRDVEELSYEEIANRLGISISAAKMRVQRARLTMKRLYKESDHEKQSSNAGRNRIVY